MKLLFLQCLISCVIFSQTINNPFIEALINNKENITDYVDKDELARSERLNIQYNDVRYKWLISFDIPDGVKAGFREGKYNYSLQQLQLENGFSVVTLAVPSVNYIQKFYFLNDKFVSPSGYFTRNWIEKESKYFKFRISEPKYFNDYCIKRLDWFVDSLCGLLEVEPERQKLLEEEKIYYTFCKDENEVEKITGYRSKGITLLAADEIVTAYQTHFHEIAHLLINFKLRNPGLYTLPFFMEGFAVAVGGRGGMAPNVVTDLGYYLQQTHFLSYDSILTNESFYREDANMTYAVSGLYNSFLLKELGGKEYLDLYSKVNGNLDQVRNIQVSDIKLPPGEKFMSFVNDYYSNRSILFLNKPDILLPDLEGKKFTRMNGYYLFEWRNVSNITVQEFNYADYISRQFQDLFPDKQYNIEMYSIITEKNKTIRAYNLLNDELIALYDINFSLENKNFDNKYYFIRANIFENKAVENAAWQQSPQ
ncbi:MAG TPA: hypothetical protein VGK25_03300 [Ignavibacteria bacterium]|jgi:hypothetical protein